MKSVYLAGPIKGLGYAEAVEWRELATKIFEGYGIQAFSPMRAKEYLSHIKGDVGGDALKDSYEQFPLSTMKAILCRDYNDCTRCDAVLVNLLGAKTVSIGTVMEVAWAHAARVPLVVIMEPAGNVHEHGLLLEACPIRVTTAEEGIRMILALLKP